MDKDILRKLQLTELRILKDVVKVLEKEKLSYFLVGGTLLGAVRHKGFIPWDDDLDIGMPRKDYNRFISMGAKALGEEYFLHCHKTDSTFWLPYAKVRMNNTVFDEPSIAGIKTHKGIFIDVFPLDNAKRQTSLFQKIQAYISKNLSTIIIWRKGVDVEQDKRFFVRAAFHVSKIFSIKFLNNIVQGVMSLNRNNDSEYFVGLASYYNYVKQTIPKNKYIPSKELEFEDGIFKVPRDYDYILRQVYGDYMKIPPIDERITHNPVELHFVD